ncbi:MAG: hypothetical protein A4E57_01230 [Syntrophorhabdaceae bacterium PtaU1.Bin034]|nr:MAG: hypothetical protein A4E57_01230 [Syntrophorhabdaceae bacterium PtaU1.Bin034]
MEPLQEMLRKFLLIIPNVAAAIAILIVGYIVARVARTLIVKLLQSSRLFNRAPEAGAPDGQQSVKMIGSVVFYFIMLLVLLAFFNALDLPIIAAPIGLLVGTVMTYLPKLLGAALILFVAWIIARLLKFLALKFFAGIRFDERVSKYFKGTATAKPSGIVAQLIFYVVLLFALPPFLEALQLNSISRPVSELWNKIAVFLPNVVAAAIIVLVGLFVAKIIREIVVNILIAIGVDRQAQKAGIDTSTGGIQISRIVGTVIYLLVLIPLFIAALDTLNIPAISGPARSMLATFLNAFPSVFAAIVIVIFAAVIGKVLRRLLIPILTGLGFNSLLQRLGIGQIGSKTPADIVGTIAFVYVVLFGLMEAAEVLQFGALVDLMRELVAFAFRLALAAVILGIGIMVGNWVKRAVEGRANDRPILAGLAKAAVIVLALAFALQNLGIANQIIIVAFTLLFGSIAVAAAIAFGVGSRATAGREVDDWVRRLKGGKPA